MTLNISAVVLAVTAAWVASKLIEIFFNLAAHPLSKFPGPLAARATLWWRTVAECRQYKPLAHQLMDLHGKYGTTGWRHRASGHNADVEPGDIIRIAPNELHFATPAAFNDIYNAASQWDKSPTQYQSFGGAKPLVSVAFLSYAEAKPRRDALLSIFSRRTILAREKEIWQNASHA